MWENILRTSNQLLSYNIKTFYDSHVQHKNGFFIIDTLHLSIELIDLIGKVSHICEVS